MGRKSRNRRAILELREVEDYYINMLCNIYTSVYTWDGLPDSVDTRYLELSLIRHGKVLFYTEEDPIGLVSFPVQAASNLTKYGYPKIWRVFGQNGFSREVSFDDSEYCYNVNSATPDWPAVLMFAKRLATIDISEDVNIVMQRFPGLLITTEEKKLTMENMMQDYMAGKYLIYGKEGLDLEDFQHIDFKVPFVADKLEYSKRDILADALNYIGIQYSSSNKKERLASTEIDSNIGFCEANRSARLLTRQNCAERLNKRYDLNVSVNINDNMVNMLKIADINPNSDGNLKKLYDSSSGEEEIV